jgi:uncharacterized protein DUF488
VPDLVDRFQTSIFTAALRGLELERLFSMLDREGVELVVDIRHAVPRSVKATPTRLSALCRSAEIYYLRQPELGAAEHSWHDRRVDRRRYRRQLATEAAALHRVAALALRHRTCLVAWERGSGELDVVTDLISRRASGRVTAPRSPVARHLFVA